MFLNFLKITIKKFEILENFFTFYFVRGSRMKSFGRLPTHHCRRLK